MMLDIPSVHTVMYTIFSLDKCVREHCATVYTALKRMNMPAFLQGQD